MSVPRRSAIRRLLFLAVIVMVINAGLLLIVHAQEGPGIARRDTLRLFLPLVLKNAGVLPPLGDMVLVPAGTFQLGCDPAHNGRYACDSDELPLHTIHLDGYWIDRKEVTNVEYAQCVGAGRCTAVRRRREDELADCRPTMQTGSVSQRARLGRRLPSVRGLVIVVYNAYDTNPREAA